MATNNAEVSSTPAAVAAPTVPTTVAADVAKRDGGKGNVTGAEVRQVLAKRFVQQVEAESAAQAATASRASNIAAPNGEKPASSAETSTSTATPEANARQETKQAPEEEASDVPSNLAHLDQKTREVVEAELGKYKESNQQKIQARIDREVAKRKALETELASARQQNPVRSPIDPVQVQQVAQPQAAPFPAQVPFSHISDPSALAAEAQRARQYHAAADDALTAGPTGARVDATGQKIELYSIPGEGDFTKDQLIQIRRVARDNLQVGIPARQQDLHLRQQNRVQAEADFPWIRDVASPEYQRAQAVANGFPFIRNMPNAENMIGIIVEGMKAVEARKAGGQQRQAARSGGTPPTDQIAFSGVGSAQSRAPSRALTAQALADERAKLDGKKGVSGRDMRKYLLASDQLRNSR